MALGTRMEIELGIEIGTGTHRVCGLDVEFDKFARQGSHSAGIVVSIYLYRHVHSASAI